VVETKEPGTPISDLQSIALQETTLQHLESLYQIDESDYQLPLARVTTRSQRKKMSTTSVPVVSEKEQKKAVDKPEKKVNEKEKLQNVRELMKAYKNKPTTGEENKKSYNTRKRSKE